MVTACSTFRETVKLFSEAAAPFYIPSDSAWGCLPTSLPPHRRWVVSVCLSGHGHPRGRVVVITWFSFAFSSWLVMLSIFPCLYWPFVYLPWRDVFSILCPFFTGWFVFLLLGCKCSLYILDTRPLSDTRFAHTLSHSVYHLFTFPIASSEARKFLVLMKSDLSIFYLVPYV